MKTVRHIAISSLCALGATIGATLIGACSMLDLSDTSGPGPVACSTASDCPGEESPCRYRVCENSVCGMAQVKSGYAPPSQLAGDCQVQICNEQAELVNVPDESDVYDDGQECTVDLCNASPVNQAKAAGESCSADDGTVCDGAGACVVCLSHDDCNDGEECHQNSCVSGECANGTPDGYETDNDCGGPECNPCADGLQCKAGSDCVSGVCTNLQCTPSTCSDAVHNGEETDVDCGGSNNCDRCSAGFACGASSDCDSGVCIGGTCQEPACDDLVTNGGETDIDCGGATSCSRCKGGNTCIQSSDCQADLSCVAGTCKNSIGIGGGDETGTGNPGPGGL